MKYMGLMIVITDMEKSKKFYTELLELEVICDFGANVQLTGGLFLQTADTWTDFIRKEAKDILFGGNAAELYFETNDIDHFMKKLGKRKEILYIHPILEHSWGQRAVRFYDPDRHIIEVAENMEIVVLNFIDGGMTAEETAIRMDVPVEYIEAILASHSGN